MCISGRKFRDTAKAVRGASAFTLVEIMVVVAIIALLAAIAVPGFMRARKRSQATAVKNDLRLIEAAVEQYALETAKGAGSTVLVTDWTNYLKRDTHLFASGEDIIGNEFGVQTVDELPIVPLDTYYELGDVVDDKFWEPFDP